MKSWKISYLFLLFLSGCLVLLSACDTSTISSSSTPIPNRQTPIATNTSFPSTQTNCPAPGTARPAVMSSMVPGSHQNIVYVSEHGGTQTFPSQALLMRYDLTTGSKTTILSFANTGTGIISTQSSPDGQWTLFIATTFSEGHYTAKLQLIRADGQMLQTLFCDPSGSIGKLQWSPDLQQVAFTGPPFDKLKRTIHLLNLATAQQEQVVFGTYSPYAWLDNTRLYVAQQQGSDPFTSLFNLYLLDTSKGANQQPGSLTYIASTPVLCGSFEKSSDGAQLLGSSCMPVRPAGCRGPATQGPSTLNVRPATGGSARTIYSSQTQAIMTFHTVNAQTLLLYIENTQGDLSQNGLWKINIDGSGLTRLTTAGGQLCADQGYTATWPQIISNGQSYALRANGSLMAGSLNGGSPTTFETLSISKGTLNLVGMVMI